MTRVVAGAVVLAAVAMLVFDALHLAYLGLFFVLAIATAPFVFVGALLIARVPRNPVGWLLTGSGLLFEFTTAGNVYTWAALVGDPGSLPGADLAAAIASASFPSGLGLAVLMLVFFPTGRGLGGRWLWLERIFITLVAVFTFINFFSDAPIPVGGTDLILANPLAIHGPLAAVVSFLAQISSATSPVILLGPLLLFLRYRRSPAVEREQIKWLAYSGTLALLFVVLSNLTTGDLSNWLFVAGVLVLGTAPIAIGIAIFRYRLYDIDVLIRRTLIYGAMSAVLLAAYVGGVALFEALLAPFTAGNGIAVAISTLAVVALFQPVRVRIRSLVDRRFYRATYNAERTLDAFAVRLRDQVDLGALRGELLAVVDETMRPERASVWLREGTSGGG